MLPFFGGISAGPTAVTAMMIAARLICSGSGQMTEQAIVILDSGGANRRILAKQAKADYRRVEQAGIKQHANLQSPEAKRLFARFFHTLQLNAHFVSDIARLRLTPEEVERIELTIRARLEKLEAALNEAIDEAAELFKANAITACATYDTLALDLDVAVISSFGRRYLEAIQSFDRLMPMLRTLEIYEVISTAEADRRRKTYKRAARSVASATRILANELRRRIDHLAPHEAATEQGKPSAMADAALACRAEAAPDASGAQTSDRTQSAGALAGGQ
jgi:hypothetical protein